MKTFPDFPLFVCSSFISVLSKDRATNCIWELTYRCNAKCSFCSYWRNRIRPGQELQLAEIKKGLDIIYKSGCRLITFSGGEPTLRDDLEEIIAYAAKKKMWTGVVTNGSRLNRTKIKGLKKAGLDNLSISLDYFEKEMHDNHRKIQGLYDKIINSLEFLGTDFLGGHRTAGILCLVSNQNLDSMKKLAEIAKRNGIFISFQLYHQQKRKVKKFKIDNIQKITTTLLEIKENNWNVISSKSYLAGMKNLYSKNHPLCSAGKKYFSIDPFGFLHPCVDLAHVGHIFTDTVAIVRSPKAMTYIKKCQGCWYCFRGEADHALSVRGSFEKIAQFGRIILKHH